MAYLELKAYSEPWYIQNADKFKTTSIFRTLSNIYDEIFCKNSYLAHFLSPSSKNKKSSYIFFYFRKWNFLALILRNFRKRKFFLYFGKQKPRKNSLYFRKRNFLIFQETSYISGSNFPCLKNEKTFYILGNGTF